MIRKKGNLALAINELSSDKNNAVAYVYHNASLAKTGLLAGAVYTLKDNFATADAPSQGSSNSLQGFQPGYDADVYKKLKKAGAVCAGKTHLDELGLGGLGIYSSNGIVTNPLDKNRIIGGSSSGAAATLTDAITFAIASDTGDSVRRPASFVGKVGFKPSYGAVSRYGLFAYASSFDTVGWLTHNVHDAVLVAKVLYGVSANDLTTVDIKLDGVQATKPTKIRYFDCLDSVEPYVSRNFKNVIMKLKADGIEVEKFAVDKTLLKAVNVVYQIISYAEASSNLGAINGIAFGNRHGAQSNWQTLYTQTRAQGFGTHLKKRIVMGAYFLSYENQYNIFLRAQKVRRIIKDYFDAVSAGCDLIIFPATPSVAPTFEQMEKVYGYTSSLLTLANISGTPSIVIPFAQHNSLPLNLALECGLKEDKKLLSFALWFEEFLEKE